MTPTDLRARRRALYALCTGMLMIVLDATIVNVALPSIRSDLGFSAGGLAWVINAYLIAFGGLLLLGLLTRPAAFILSGEMAFAYFIEHLPHSFYPVLNEDYATRIARDWNVKASGVGYVTRFEVEEDYLDRFAVQQVGGQTILEYWIPAEQLDEFNTHIVGLIEVVAEFR